jgi:tRNA-2-methylthio-N6-dimethylallyladenosine synthase
MDDDVAEEEKGRRVSEITAMQHAISGEINATLIGRIEPVLVEGRSRKSETDLSGRTDANRTVVFPGDGAARGQVVQVKIERANSATLFGTIITGGDA